MTNFAFLKTDFPELYSDIEEAESLVFSNPTPSAIMSRSVLENAVNWLYEKDRKLTRPFRSDLSTLMHDEAFRGLFNNTVFRELNLVRKVGNSAAHGTRVSEAEALASVKYLFRFLRFLVIYYGDTEPKTQAFDDALVPKPASVSSKPAAVEGFDAKSLKKLLDNIDLKNKEAREKEEQIREQARENAELKRQLEQHQQAIETRKIEREQTLDFDEQVPLLISEAETRKRYIDVLLNEAGWGNLQQGRDLEYKVSGMPKSTNPSGTGYVDYVLWADNGLPLAVVEAKRATENVKKGKQQAVLYANCLEAETGQRPIVFYSNGYDTYLWDDQFYPEREVAGFLSKDELQLLINRRDKLSGRQDLRQFKVNQDIAGKGRPYQLEAIQRVAENSVGVNAEGRLVGRFRRSLLVMATGSGKTRTSAALVDMMTKCNWVKRVLFLADRNALVSQAKNAFNEHLPHLSAIDLTKEKEDAGTRLVFSTYPTIMNRIDGTRAGDNDDERFYGVGHFDLIIVDEAHRSVYQKYGAIFDYFDAMMVGLTATPKNDVSHDTYGLFEIEDNNPTFAYELDEAVDQGHLVPPKGISVPLKFVREGVKYNELSDDEKQRFEEQFGDPTTGDEATDIPSTAVNNWLFNTNTVDQALDYLMNNGIHVQGGDKLGKTIIFAKNHSHAEFIEKRFNKNYPEKSGSFLRVIDNYESKAQDLLETFADEHKELEPQIAVSVDMMDTGVDAPRVVNLMFFKPVKSYTKYWQMIGRGTRLCKDLFAIGEDKTEFLIFDCCENFEFFGDRPDGMSTKPSKKLSQRIFDAKLNIALLIRENAESSDEQKTLSQDYVNELHGLVSGLNKERFEVRKHLQIVEKYSSQGAWQTMSDSEKGEVSDNLSGLIVPAKEDDEYARRLDILVLNYQVGLLESGHKTEAYKIKLVSIGAGLLKKLTVPEVANQKAVLQDTQKSVYWENITVNQLELLRTSIRGLMKYLDKPEKAQVITHFEDTLDADKVTEHDLMPNHTKLKSYRDRVESYVRDNSNHVVIHKLRNNLQITQSDLDELERILFNGYALGTKEQYKHAYGDKPLGEFIRAIVGLDVAAANAAFTDFIDAGSMSADQMTFINQIIRHLTTNGVIDKGMLFEPPFTHIHDQGLFGVFNEQAAGEVIRLVDMVNERALVNN